MPSRTCENRPVARAVIFDMDGLIVDSEPFWRRVESDAFDAIGADIRPFLGHGRTMGMRVDEAVRVLLGLCSLEDVDAEKLSEHIVAGVVDAITNEATLMPGVHEALALCERHNLRIALASGSTPPVITAVLERFDLTDTFAVVHSAIDDLLGKPHPAIFLRTATELGCDPTACVVLEDSLNGCIAGKAANMSVIAIPHANDFGDPRFQIADLRLRSLFELADPEASELLGIAESTSSDDDVNETGWTSDDPFGGGVPERLDDPLRRKRE